VQPCDAQPGDRQDAPRALREMVGTVAQQPPLAVAVRCPEPERPDGDIRAREAQGARIVAVDDLHFGADEDARLRGGVVVHAAIAIEMVFRQIEHHRGIGPETRGRLELEARQLQHDRLRPRPLAGFDPGQRVEHRQADVARDQRLETCAATQGTGHLRNRALAIGAGDREDLRSRQRQLFGPGRNGDSEQLDVPDHADASGDRSLDLGLGERHAGTRGDEVRVAEARRTERAEIDGQLRELAPHRIDAGRLGAGIGRAHVSAVRRQPADHGHAGGAEAEDENALAGDVHRSFSVDSPNRTSIIVMIQNRTTTWFSFQPFSS
jgi:hypothetical protein